MTDAFKEQYKHYGPTIDNIYGFHFDNNITITKQDNVLHCLANL